MPKNSKIWGYLAASVFSITERDAEHKAKLQLGIKPLCARLNQRATNIVCEAKSQPCIEESKHKAKFQHIQKNHNAKLSFSLAQNRRTQG